MPEDQESEVRLYIQRMLELKAEYTARDGTAKPSCQSGVFNTNIEFFDKKSPLVIIVRLSPKTLFQFIKDFYELKFDQLTTQERTAMLKKTKGDESYDHAAWLKLVHTHKDAFIQSDDIADGLKNNFITLGELEAYFAEIEENGSMEHVLELPLKRYRSQPSPLQSQSLFAAPAPQPLPVPQPPQEDAMDLNI